MVNMGKRPETIHDLRKDPQNGHDKWATRLKSERRGQVSWADVGPEDLTAALVAVTEDGAALLLSTTSDGGALVIQVLTSSGAHKLYPASMSELNEALDLITRIAKGQN